MLKTEFHTINLLSNAYEISQCSASKVSEQTPGKKKELNGTVFM